jgi:transcriptional regulator with XRE-family HTH domain
LTFEQRIIRRLAVRIRELRRAKGWSQEWLAEEAGIETARRNPSLKNLIRIAKALGTTMAGLFQDV